MSVDIKQNVDTNSMEFKEGVEAGPNSEEETKNLKASDELGQALKDEGEKKGPVNESLFKKHTVPLFMRDSSDGHHGNAQDEKDEMEE